MKRVLIQIAIGAILVIIGFIGGRLFENMKSGYHFEVRQQKEFQSSMGPVEWSYITESIGLPLLDPGTTMIKFGNRTIYKAQRYFQEEYPFARNIQTSGKSIMWNDGEFKFDLTIEAVKKETNSPESKAAGFSTN